MTADPKSPRDMALEEAIAFLNRIEGDGYGGEAQFENARRGLRLALSQAPDGRLAEIAARAMSFHLTGSEDAWREYVDDVKPILAALSPIDELLKQCLDALAVARVAMNDWAVQYAPTECGRASIEECHRRIISNGGTLAYIAGVSATIRESTAQLAAAPPRPSPADDVLGLILSGTRPWPKDDSQ